MNDLRPYICTFPECGQAKRQYHSRHIFGIHEFREHVTPTGLTGRVSCPFCQKVFPKWKTAGRVRHIGRHMEEIAFAVVPKAYEEWEFYSNSSGGQSAPQVSAFVCRFAHCSESFGSESDRIEHQNVGHCFWRCGETSAYRSGLCNRQFRHGRIFLRHLRDGHCIKDENVIKRRWHVDKWHGTACMLAKCELKQQRLHGQMI